MLFKKSQHVLEYFYIFQSNNLRLSIFSEYVSLSRLVEGSLLNNLLIKFDPHLQPPVTNILFKLKFLVET